MSTHSNGRKNVAVAMVGAAVVLASVGLAGVARGASPGHDSAVLRASLPTYTWPSIRGNSSGNGLSADPAISASDASLLGISWMTPTGAPVLSSPVVAYNVALGKTLIYSGNEAGNFEAVSQATGNPIWSVSLGSSIRASALVEGSSVWVAPSATNRVYKLDAATGAVRCSAPTPPGLGVDSSPTIATPPGGSPTVYLGVNDGVPGTGPLLGIAESDCSVLFSSTPEPAVGTGGIWDPISYGVNANGEAIALFGTSDPDSAVYAVDAVTGRSVWRFAVANPAPGTYDVGAGVVVSPPGANGFANGVAYVESKFGIMYALDLTTGVELWEYNFGAVTGISPPGSLATAGLSGTDLVTGTAGGIDDVNAVTGALKWRYSTGDTNDVDSSMVITGPVGDQVVAFTTLSGAFDVISLASGSLLYQHQTGGFAVSSVADVDGNLVVTSGDGYLYDFGLGGGNSAAPTTAITNPLDGSTAANPGLTQTITGTAAGTSIGEVDVAVQKGGSSGPWWDSATGTWTTSPYPNLALLSAPGSASTTWSLSLPMAQAGGGFEIFASAVASSGQADLSAFQGTASAGRVGFTVRPAPGPTVTVSSAWVATGQSVAVSGTGFSPSESVTLSFGSAFTKVVTASPSGTLTRVPVAVAPTTPFGPETLVATGGTSGLSTTATFTVANAWSQYLHDPTHQAADANDSVFFKHLSVSAPSYMARAWSFNTGAPVRSSVSVVNGVAYAGNDAGAVFAVNVHTGTQLWRYQDVGSKPIDSTPAVVGTDVIFGTAAGSVVDLNAATGAVRWVTTYGRGLAVESSPAVVNGVAYVGSDNDKVTALSTTSKGAILWQTTLGGAVKSSPAVDAAAGLLFVGSDDGKVAALSLTTGAVQWSIATGGPVDASPLVSLGVVYVGSADHTFYALNEATGATVWSVSTGAPITASASLNSGDVIVGSDDGHVYWLSAKTGAVVYNYPVSGPVTGVGSATSFSIATTANGGVRGSKPAASDLDAWQVNPLGPTATIVSTPTVVNGEVFVSRQDGTIACYTIPGSSPI